MKGRLLVIAVAAVAAGLGVQASAQPVSFYDAIGNFHAAAIGSGKVLAGVEDFEVTTLLPQAVAVFDDPLDADTDNGIFVDGDIHPGLQVQSNVDPTGRSVSPKGLFGLAAYGSTYYGGSIVVGASEYPHSTDLIFNDANRRGVGLDLFQELPIRGILIQVFDADNVLIGSTQLGGGDADGLYIGILAETTIGRINIAGAESSEEFVDNIEMWNASPVPEPFTMGLAGLALAAAARRRLRKSA